MYRKLKQPTEEAAALEAWLTAYEHHATVGTVDKNATRAKRSLQKRYDRLMRASRELDALLVELRADLEAVKAEHGGAAPHTCDRIQEILSMLGGANADQPSETTEGKMSSVYLRAKPTSELDLIGESSLGNADGTSYPETGVMLLEYKNGGKILQPIDAVSASEHYVYEMRMIPEPQSNRWLSGLVFGIEGPLERFFGAFVKDGTLILHRVAERGRIKEDVAVKRLHVKAGKALILTVLVEEQSIEVYVNGKKEISYTAPREHSLSGTPAVWMQDVIARVLALRLGRIE